MSTTIDNRVVKMTFDNAQFERGVKATMKIMEDFEKKLTMEGATAGFDKIKNAANKLNLSALTDQADKVKSKFSDMGLSASDSFKEITRAAETVDMSGISDNAQDAMTDTQMAVDSLKMGSISDELNNASEGFDVFKVIAVGALLEVGQQITEFVTGGLSKLLNGIKGLGDAALWQPLKDGFREYETQMGSIQTIMANTGRDFHDSTDIKEVNSALDELNEYADKTIYNFTEMTRNVGTFTAAGLDLYEAVPAIQGIANMAAISGSTSQQASTAMYQLSQALSAGTLKLQDWNSVVNAGMGGKVFQDKLLETARHIHETNGEMGMYGETIEKVTDGSLTFRESLKNEWITSEVLSEALAQLTYSTDGMTKAEQEAAEAHLKSLGYTDEEIEHVFELGQTAMESATKVRTWSQLWDTIGEALGSGWTKTWQILIGDFEEATNLFTYLSKEISGVVDAVSDARNAIIQGWADFGGRDLLFGIFDDKGNLTENGILQNIVDTIKGWATPISDAFSDVFTIFAENKIEDDYDPGYAKALKKGAEEAEEYRKEYLEPFIDEFGRDSEEYRAQVELLDNTKALSDLGTFEGFDPETFLLDEVGQGLAAVTDGFKELTESLIPSQDAMMGVHGIFSGFFSLLNVGLTAIGAVIKAFSGLVKAARIVIDPLVDIALTIGGSLGRALTALCDYIIQVINSFVHFGNKVYNAVVPAVQSMVKAFLDMVKIPEKIRLVTDFIIGFLDVLWDFIDLPGKIAWVGDTIADTFNGIKDFIFGASDEAEKSKDTFKGAIPTISGYFSSLKTKIEEAFPAVKTFGTHLDNLKHLIFESSFEEQRQVLEAFFNGLSDGLQKVTTPFINLGNALKDFSLRIIEFIKNFEPIRGTITLAKEFASSVSNAFLSIPEKIAGFGAKIRGENKEAAESFDLLKSVQDAADYFSNVTVEQFLADAQNLKDNFVGNIKNAFENIKNINVDEAFNDMGDKLIGWSASVSTFGSSIKTSLIKAFPSAAEAIDSSWKTIDTAFNNGVRRIANTFKVAIDETDSLPKAIFKVAKEVVAIVKDAINGMFKAISNIKVEDIINMLTVPFAKLGDWIKTNFPETAKYIDAFSDGFNKFIDSLNLSGKTIGDVVLGAIKALHDTINENFPAIGKFIDDVVSKFNSLPDGIKTAINYITKALSDLPGIFGWAFGGLSAIITGFTTTSKLESAGMPGAYDEMFGGLEDHSVTAGDAFRDFMTKFDPANIPDFLRNLAETVINKIKDQIDKIKIYLKDIPEKIKQVAKDILGDEGTIQELLDALKQVVEGVLMIQIGNFIKNLGNSLNNYTKYLKNSATNDFSEKMRNIAIAIGIVAAVVYKLGEMKPEQLQQGAIAAGAIGTFLIAMLVIPEALKKWEKTKFDYDGSSNNILKAAGAIALAAYGVKMMLDDIEKLGELQKTQSVIKEFAEILVGVAALTAVLQKMGGTEAAASGAGIMMTAIAINLLIGPLKELSTMFNDAQGAFDPGKISNISAGILAIGALMFALSTLSNSTNGLDLIETSAALVIFGISVGLMSNGLSTLAQCDWGSIIAGGAAIAALTLALGQLANMTQEADLIGTSAAMIVFSVAVAIMSAGLSVLAQNDWESIIAGGAAISMLTLALGALSMMTQETDLMATSAAMIVFGAAVAIMSVGLAQLAQCDWEGIIAAAGAITVLMIALGGLANLTQEADLIATSAALVVFGVAVAAMSVGLAQLAQCDWERIAVATRAIAALMIVLGVIAGVLAQVPASIAVLVALAAAMLAAGVAALAIAEAISIATDAFIRFVEAGPAIDKFVQLIAEHVDKYAIAAVGLAALGAALIPLGAGLIVFGAGALVAGAGLAALGGGLLLISDGIRAFLELLADLPELLTNASESIGGFIASIPEKLGALLTNIKTWFETEFLPGIGGFLTGIKDWFFNEFLPGIQQLGTDLWNWITTEFIPGIPKFIEDCINNLRNFINDLGNWFNNEFLPGIFKMGEDIVNWFNNEAIPGIQKFIEDIFTNLGKLGEDFVHWATVDAPAAVGKAIEDIMNEAGKIFDKIIEWGKGIPKAVEDGVGNLLTDLQHIGEDIVNGIVNGINNLPNAIGDAIGGLVDGAVNNAKALLGIHSPSTVMRDEVGRYIPMGLGEGIDQYAYTATDAATELAKDTSTALADNIDSSNLSFEYGFEQKDTPYIKPVVDMNEVMNKMMAYNDLLANLDFSASQTMYQEVQANVDLTPLNTTISEQTSKLNDITKKIEDISKFTMMAAANIEALSGYMQASAIVMDSGELVGAILPEMDRALGYRQILAERGAM